MAAGKPVVIGTTGHSAAEKEKLLKLAAKVPCVWTGNFSVGVNLLFALTRRAAKTLGDDYDIEIVEMHHRMKKDAPSGTAARLFGDRAAGSAESGRAAFATGARNHRGADPGEVGVHSLRGGDA